MIFFCVRFSLMWNVATNLRVVFIFALRFVACIIPKTTAANELWCDVWRFSDGEWSDGTPPIGDIIWLAETPLPNTQYVVMIPLPFTVISPRFYMKAKHKSNICRFKYESVICRFCMHTTHVYPFPISNCAV